MLAAVRLMCSLPQGLHTHDTDTVVRLKYSYHRCVEYGRDIEVTSEAPISSLAASPSL